MAILRSLPWMGAVLILAGCVTTTSEDRAARCAAAVELRDAARDVVLVSRELGLTPTDRQERVLAAAELAVALRCPEAARPVLVGPPALPPVVAAAPM